MADSRYPSDLDDDTNLVRIDDNLSELGSEAINALRSAVFSIEETLGVNPQSSSSDVASRLNQSLNADGTIKATALEAIGLITLPITNDMFSVTHKISETYLDLNYPSKELRELIGALRIEHDALVLTVQGDITNLARHVAHPATLGRHYTSDIDGYIGNYSNSNLQGIVSDLDTRILNHVSDTSGAHEASAISFDDTNTYISSDEVQDAIEKLDNLGYTTLITHQDSHHSNGLLSAQKVYSSGTNHGEVLVSSNALNVISSGSLSVAFTTPPSELADVNRGDRIDITMDGTTYVRDIKDVDPDTGIVDLFVALPTDGIVNTGIIYKSTEEVSTPSSLNLAIRQDSITGNTGGSVIQLIHPSSPFVLSDGLDVRAISSSTKNIKFAWEGGETGDIDVYQALQTYPVVNTTPSIWTPENLAIALNYEFKKDANVYPLIAFTYKGEVGVAYDEPDGYVAVKLPSTLSALSAFGFDGYEVEYSSTPRRFYIDGYEFSTIRKIVDATAETDTSSVIKNISADLIKLGIGQTGIVRLKNHADAGTYVFNASASNSLTISSHIGGFATDSSVNVEIYSDYFAVPTPLIQSNLYELFIDAYGSESGELKAAPRVEYLPGGGSTADPHKWFDILEISRNFPIGTKRINFTNSGGIGYVKLGDPVTSPATSTDVSSPGAIVTLPSSNEPGYKFRLYAYNNVDYVDLEITSNYTLALTDQAIDLIVHPRISEEKYLQVGQVLHDSSRFKNLSDRRLSGTIGRKDIRNDFTRDYISYPRSLTRGNGVVYGCEVSGSLVVGGGEVLVDGDIFAINRTGLEVPDDGVTSTYNVFVDSDGILRFLKDNQEIATSGFYTPSTQEIILSSDKTLLAKIEVNSSGTITEIQDLRRFVGRLDNKIDLIVGEDNYETFASLQSAVNFLNALDNSVSSPRIIKIRGRMVLTSDLTLPGNCILEGDSIGANSIGSRIELSSCSIIINSANVILRNLTFYSSSANSNGLVGNLSGGGISNARIENCTFQYNTQASNNIALGTDSITNSIVQGCSFINVDFGIIMSASEKTIIKDCYFNEVYTSAITLDDVEDTIIENNFITSSSLSITDTDGIIKLIDPVRAVISKNIIRITDTGTASGSAILINNTSQDCNISNNYLRNTGSEQGLKKAIVLDGANGASGLDHIHDSIMDNKVIGFFGGSAQGIAIENGYGTKVFLNNLYNCRAPFTSYNCPNIEVSNNTFASLDDATLISMTHNTTHINNKFINNNVISTASTITNRVINFQSSRSQISGNFITTETNTKAHLYVDSTLNAIITNNIFRGTVSYTSEAVLELGSAAYNCLITDNDFKAISSSGPMITDGGANNTDHFNKGQTYYYKPCIISGDEDSSFPGWDKTFGSSREEISSTSATAAYNICFPNKEIPVGSTITKVEIYYSSASVPSSSDFDISFLNQDWNEDAYTLLFTTSVDGTSGSFTPAEVQSVAFSHEVLDKRYLIVLSMTASNLVKVRGINISYTL